MSSMHEFLEEIQKDTLPFAMRIIRDKLGMNLRDDDPDDIVLPLCMMKHSVYAQWCHSKGWKLTKKSSYKTIYNPLSLHLPRPFDDDDDDDDENGLWPPRWREL
eukprot:15347570-Ditylum_brightwellii.AAC.1